MAFAVTDIKFNAVKRIWLVKKVIYTMQKEFFKKNHFKVVSTTFSEILQVLPSMGLICYLWNDVFPPMGYF